MPCVSNVDFHVGNYVNNGIEGTTEGYENHNAIDDLHWNGNVVILMKF